MADNFTLITKNIVSFDEMQKFAEAQHKTIIELSRKIKKLEDEKFSLEALLKSVDLPVMQQEDSLFLTNLAAEEYIATIQLEKLKHLSKERELTLEEARKVEIFTKILTIPASSKPKDIKAVAKKMSDEDLLRSLTVEDKDEVG